MSHCVTATADRTGFMLYVIFGIYRLRSTYTRMSNIPLFCLTSSKKQKLNNHSIERGGVHAHILCVCACSGWGRELGVCSYSSNTNSSIGGQVSDQLH